MSQFYCFICDRYRDSDTEDIADYLGDTPICGSCVQDNLDKQLQETWHQLDNDEQAIKEFCNAG